MCSNHVSKLIVWLVCSLLNILIRIAIRGYSCGSLSQPTHYHSYSVGYCGGWQIDSDQFQKQKERE